MKFLFASDSFKGSLSSQKTAELLKQAAYEIFPEAETDFVPLADGGEGTVEAVVSANAGSMLRVPVHGPLLESTEAEYGIFSGKQAIIEMAAASGLVMVPEEKRNPLHTSSYGTGELIRDALDRGIREISIAIGGSATNDGGMGALSALGVRFLDAEGRRLSGKGEDLEKIHLIDDTGLDPRLRDSRITVLCDVTNPLTGEDGATYTFSKQKGATPEIQKQLEAGMEHYRALLQEKYDVDCNAIPGTGAAGGLGAALLVFLHGEMVSGIEAVLKLVQFDEKCRDADLIITGEGRTDWQSAFGKVMMGVGEHGSLRQIPVVGLSASLGERAEQMYEHGIASLVTTVDAPMTLSEALARAEELYYQGAIRMFRLIRVGMEIQRKS